MQLAERFPHDPAIQGYFETFAYRVVSPRGIQSSLIGAVTVSNRSRA
jgi:hypothetical protein